MTYEGIGRVIKGVGGLFTVRMERGSDRASAPLDGKYLFARGRGILRQKGSLLVGDRVRVAYDDSSFTRVGDEIIPSPDGTGIVIEEILPRSCALIRPPMANLDVLFVTFAAAAPDPILETVDKLISIAEYNQQKVLSAFINNRVSESNFAPTTGYGYGDKGRDDLDKILAKSPPHSGHLILFSATISSISLFSRLSTSSPITSSMM